MKSSSLPRLSIGIPVYNGEKFIGGVLECLAAQSFTDFEVVICDNASTDQTQAICRLHSAADPRIRYFRNQSNLGATANFNRVFELSAKTEYFKWAASDDLFLPGYLERCIEILDAQPDVTLAHTGTAFIDEDSNFFPTDPVTGMYTDPRTGALAAADSTAIGDSDSEIRRFWQVLSMARWGTHMFGVIRRPVLETTRLLPNFPSSDRAMLAELALLGRFKSVPDKLFLKRFHGKVSWAMPMHELKAYLDTSNKSYSRRTRQIAAYMAAPRGKPIGMLSKVICSAMVAVHSARVFSRAISGVMTREARHMEAWREKSAASELVPDVSGVKRVGEPDRQAR